MTHSEIPELFYKDRFCKAVCGYTNRELLDIVSKKYVDPLDEGIAALGGRDMPREGDEKIIGRQEIFMGASFRFPLLDLPMCLLYEAFEKFRAWERYVHPRDQFRNHARYWDPRYAKIEKAHNEGDEEAFKREMIGLIDDIIHD